MYVGTIQWFSSTAERTMVGKSPSDGTELRRYPNIKRKKNASRGAATLFFDRSSPPPCAPRDSRNVPFLPVFCLRGLAVLC